MPIIVPPDLPTRWMLDAESIFVVDHATALRQDARPLRVALVISEPFGAGSAAGNAAATADAHAAALARLLAGTPLQIDLAVFHLSDAGTKEGLARAHRTAGPLGGFDGLVIAHGGAGEQPWHQSPGWDELRDLLDWAAEHIRAHLYLGWAAHAALAHVYGIQSHRRSTTPPALVAQRVVRRASFLLRGFNDSYPLPSITRREVLREEVLDAIGLEILTETAEGEPALVRSYDRRKVFALHHPLPPGIDAPAVGPGWHGHAALLLANWINYYVYQPVSYLLRGQDGRPAA